MEVQEPGILPFPTDSGIELPIILKVWGSGASQTKTVKGYDVRVDWESPGNNGNVHVTVDGGKIFISDPSDLSGLPKSLRNNDWVQKQVQRAFGQMTRFEEDNN
jgi:hypothetical protein